MRCPVCEARSFASDSRPVKRPLGNELDEVSSTALGPGRRRSYCCANDHRFTTYEVLGGTLLDTAVDARGMRQLRRMLAREHEAKL
jgi:transcriptional regulator NrdR family protein